MDLTRALELFNRKERNLLIREALGDQVEHLKLSEPFRARVASALHIDCILSTVLKVPNLDQIPILAASAELN
jgi:hypothetical protein